MTSSLTPSRRFAPPRRKRVLLALAYYEHRMHLGAARYAREANWILDTRMAHYDALPDDWEGDGILTLALPSRPDLTRYLRKARVPIVALTADVEKLTATRVLLDNFRMGQLAAEHLLERGFQHLAFFKCTDYTDVRDREAGFAAAVKAAGLDYARLDWHAAARKNRHRSMVAWLVAQLRKQPKPLGVMGQSDHRAYSVINACEAAGLAIPEQVAVVGVDNDPYTCELAPVPITSVDSNRAELAYRGAELLDRLMDGQEAPTAPVVIPAIGLVVRRSSDTLAIEDPEVAKAVSFIWQHYDKRIGVADVVASTLASRCVLYKAFKHYVGRTIREELERKRIEHARQLLLTSTDKVHHIARQCGFGSGEQFCRAYARVTGSTPSDFRAA
ncbi:MAG: substrate-binding domain-containing protein, partial [Patescibacteria group bacterium]|nr:substrate-binding domain-containing protein [Patescibacteria group bacterium]